MRSSAILPENSASAAAAAPPPPRLRRSWCLHLWALLTRRIRGKAQRELSPQTKRTPKNFWGKASNRHVDSSGMKTELAKDARQELRSWAEAESLLHLSAKYCPLLPPPRSTIAAAFSPDGKTLASTHGDHTVKIIDCPTGKCLKVLSGHRRTPWVVRFHPLYPEVLASGSLDHEVRLWDAKTAECIGSRDFYRPIASIAFHAQGEILAVASGHKLYIWHYNRRGEASSPTIILKTRRSLRAVHFHPHGAPFLLTAEVNDLDSSDPTMTLATSPGGDASLLAQQTETDMTNVPQQRAESSASVRLFTYSTPSGQYELVLSPIQSPVREEPQNNSLTREMENAIPQPAVDAMETDGQAEDRNNQFFPFGDPAYWELPFLQGWLIGQSQAGQRAIHSQTGGPVEAGRSGSRHRSSRSRTRPATGTSDNAAFNSIPLEQNNSQPFMSQVQSEVATSLAAAAAAELPCTVKLRIWSHDVKNPCVPLDTERCRLTIPHAVLCRYDLKLFFVSVSKQWTMDWFKENVVGFRLSARFNVS
ncbi:UNVERIFIED_CONTAM: Eukaryotic translation initiation factor 3 subunit I [Sesamum radiatum]|uniref:Eukaryotic translation initiation factor 3 subunit I n=1 Tax=Sesamum radiatum TaxID=300843 RepID=A0AAW2UBH3_SESRA